MKKSLRVWSLLLSCLAALGQGALPSKAQAPAVAVQQNVVYGEAGGEKLLLDIYGANPATKHPAIIFVHGGGWSGGSKNQYNFAATAFARRGYVGFSIDYRLMQDGRNRYPAQVDDVQRAVRWVRAHASEYGVDPQRIGALGDSASGYLVALLGTTETRDNRDAELAAYSSRVECVVDLYGPTDFTEFLELGAEERAAAEQLPGTQMVQNFLGRLPESAANYSEASPVTHVDEKTVPFLIFHGAKDDLVPLDQSKRLDMALRAAGVESKLIIFPNAGHGFSDPALLSRTLAGAQQFFDRHLMPVATQ